MKMRPRCRTENVVVQEFEDEVLIYDLKINKAYCLNETSALVWQLCDGKHTVTEISDEMGKRLKTLISEDFLFIALDQLNKDGLLEDGLGSNLESFSRREAIRKVGFASMVALPIVSSIVAPHASMAQSGLLANCAGPCTSGTQCVSGICSSQSTPTTGQRVCSINPVGLASGFEINACAELVQCNSVQSQCCIGTATFVVTGCTGIPTNGTCTCN